MGEGDLETDGWFGADYFERMQMALGGVDVGTRAGFDGLEFAFGGFDFEADAPALDYPPLRRVGMEVPRGLRARRG